MEIALQALLAELDRRNIRYRRVDTADAADTLGNRGRWTVRNVTVALGHLAGVVRDSFRRDVTAVYVPIAQDFPALVRDIAFAVVALVARRPLIVHLHGGQLQHFYASQPRVVRTLLRHTLGRATLGIVLTERLRPSLECLLPPSRVIVVPNGIDFRPTGFRKRLDDGTVRVLYLSSLYPWKGHRVFVDAFARAHRACPELRATVAGDWPSTEVRAGAEELVRDLGVEDVVSFPGPVTGHAKEQLFEDADLFCFTSLVQEGQPLVILEAMASGLPVVAPAYPGIADTVVDGETGMLLGAPTPEEVADRLVALARDEGLRLRLGSAGRRRYEDFFTQAAFGERIVRALEPFLYRGQVEVRGATAP
jgi:glycosyltransferase involved in cell wall biosynthesis